MNNLIAGIPPITKAYMGGVVITTALWVLKVVSGYQLYFNWALIVNNYEYWRLIT
jgi:hypothetical protein